MNVGRNELCPCGSGKKYKKCCIYKETNKKLDKPIENNIIEELQDETEVMWEIVNNFREFILKNKPHIKEYKKIRKIHGEILDSMMDYYDNGKFELRLNDNVDKEELLNSTDLKIIDMCMDTGTQLGAQALAHIIVYKNSCNMNCLTEEYINKKRFRKPEKIEFLNSMLNSKAGLFEIIKTDRDEGQVHIQNVLTKERYCLTDIGLSGNLCNDSFYLYTRIITYNGITFGTGLSLAFDKKDKFICKWIEENSKNYNPNQEIARFMELYNKYQTNDKRFKTKVNSF